MAGTISFLVDCASYQGVPDWARVAATCIGGAEKVTEGTGYVNPDWAASKSQLTVLAAHGFVPLAYMFLDASGSGAAQAQHFAAAAGKLDGWGIAIDLERAPDGSPSRQQAIDAAAEVRRLYPGRPVGGYAPHWYTGGEDLSFFDWLWASEYVSGSGDPAMLYRGVPASWWAPYGGRSPLLLQFTPAATVAGVSGPVDCSAFQGTRAQLASHVLPAPPKPPPPPVPVPPRPVSRPGDSSMLIPLHPGDAPVTLPVWTSAAAWKEQEPYASASLVLTGGNGAVVKVTAYAPGLIDESVTVPLATGTAHPVVLASPWSRLAVVQVQRLDTKAAVPATAAFRNW
ncbi:MAG: glycoside hydrolase family 25 [Actinomycetia bacterium]|nr:glycoside hydrolase family 25 [Actinomycetes bacterium]